MPLRRLPLLIGPLCAALALPGVARSADPVADLRENPLAPTRTTSPRATYESFLTHINGAWHAFFGEGKGGEGDRREAERQVERAARCFDLSEVPPASRATEGIRVAVLLLDVLNRIDAPSPRDVPNAEAMAAEERTSWTLPGTRIVISRMEEGSRAGEWLFTAETVERAKEFYTLTRELSLRPGAVIDDGYQIFISMPGWMIPLSWIEGLPEWARRVYAEQPVWQWVLAVALLALVLAAIGLAVRWSRRAPLGREPRRWRALGGPAAIVASTPLAAYLLEYQIAITGEVWTALDIVLSTAFFLGAAWGVVILGGITADLIVASPRIRPGSIDENIVRLTSRLVSFVLAVFIGIEGARAVGVPVVGVIAGLGVGGLAVALAAQSTIENFIGSLTIFADRPVRVGDLCRFGDQLGTVEEIGLRSTRIRTLERSVLTVPNAEFSRLSLDNLSLRDRILFRTTLSLRLETTSDQLRLVLARLRELLVGHPKVHEDRARVRLVATGPSSLDLEVYAYLATSDWGEFLAIREDLFLRIIEVVEKAGTSFAPPARTHYAGSGSGVDEERAASAAAEVEKWRRDTALPFPDFSPEQKSKLADTLDYPPAGSARRGPGPGEDER